MRHIIKFKSFVEADNYAMKEFFKKKFNPQKMDTFFQDYSGRIKNPYKPGVYKFKSFEQARKYDVQLRIKKK